MARLLLQPTSAGATCCHITYADNFVVKLYLFLLLFLLSWFFISHFSFFFLLLLLYTFVAFCCAFSYIFFTSASTVLD